MNKSQWTSTNCLPYGQTKVVLLLLYIFSKSMPIFKMSLETLSENRNTGFTRIWGFKNFKNPNWSAIIKSLNYALKNSFYTSQLPLSRYNVYQRMQSLQLKTMWSQTGMVFLQTDFWCTSIGPMFHNIKSADLDILGLT